MKTIKNLFVLFALILSSKAMALSPPWYLFQRQVQSTLGRDSCVRVDNLQQASSSLYHLNIHVCRQSKAAALAAFMERNEQIGNIAVRVHVLYRNTEMPHINVPNNVTQARQLVSRALSGNRYYLSTVQGNAVNAFFIRFSKSVVQYPGDNLADAYGNINEVAADAFHHVLGLDAISNIRIGTSTLRSNALMDSEDGSDDSGDVPQEGSELPDSF